MPTEVQFKCFLLGLTHTSWLTRIYQMNICDVHVSQCRLLSHQGYEYRKWMWNVLVAVPLRSHLCWVSFAVPDLATLKGNYGDKVLTTPAWYSLGYCTSVAPQFTQPLLLIVNSLATQDILEISFFGSFFFLLL